jgi:L-aminopeptidase/D-esterase-like protein
MRKVTVGEIEGLLVGHAEKREMGAGCTAILAPAGAVASVFAAGCAPGVLETELLKPDSAVRAIHGLLFAGGGVCGLAAVSGVVRWLKEKGVGLDAKTFKIPLVPAAVIHDYPGNRSNGRLPDEAMGYEAARCATAGPVWSGPFGAGVSASAGRIGGPSRSTPTGLGSSGLEVRGIKLAVLAVVNALGSVIEPVTGEILSGLRRPDGRMAVREEIIEAVFEAGLTETTPLPGGCAVLAAVATNAALDKPGTAHVARMAAAGVNRAVYPSHLLHDGDAVFALSTNDGPRADENWLGALAAEVVSQAIVDAALRLVMV